METLKVFRTRALMVRGTLRLPLREWFSGSSSARRRTPSAMRGGPPAGSARALGGLRAARRRAQPARALLHLVGLDDVADLDVVVRLQPDPALVPAGHLAHVLLEAAQTGDPPLVHHDVVAQQT